MLPNISKSILIDGWMTKEELEWLAAQASQHEIIVEIGSYKGRSTRALVDNTQGKVFAVDHWQGDTTQNLSEEEQQNLYMTFLENMGDVLAEGKLQHLKTDHANIREDFVSNPDFVFIDAHHGYEHVKYDITFWLHKLKKGGLICGHDYLYSDVRRAVDELLPSAICSVGTIWSATKN